MTVIVDPSGWSVENNPHPPNEIVVETAKRYNRRKSDDELDVFYFEYDRDGWHHIVCHCCLLRAKYDSGNCMDGGEYFKCLKMDDVVKGRMKRLEESYGEKPIKTVQSTLF